MLVKAFACSGRALLRSEMFAQMEVACRKTHRLSAFRTCKLFNYSSSLAFPAHRFARFHLLAKVIHHHIAHVAFLRLGRNKLRSFLKGRHAVVALHHIIVCGHAILRLWVDGFAVDGGAFQLSVLVTNLTLLQIGKSKRESIP